MDMPARAEANSRSSTITVRTYPTNSDALVQLRSRAGSRGTERPPAFLVIDARRRAHYQPASTTQYEPGRYGMAFRKS